jgi:hypothetical protein
MKSIGLGGDLFPVRLGMALGVSAALGCSTAPAKAPGAPPRAPAVEPGPAAPPMGAPALALTADEELIRERLEATTKSLRALGERNESRPWELADATEYIDQTLAGMGVSASRRTHESSGVAYHEFAVEILGEGAPFEVVAYYDTEPTSPSADASRGKDLPPGARGALGPAIAMELMRIFAPARLTQSLRIVLTARPPKTPAAPPNESVAVGAAGGHGPAWVRARLVLAEGLGAGQVVLSRTQPSSPLALPPPAGSSRAESFATPPAGDGWPTGLWRELTSDPLSEKHAILAVEEAETVDFLLEGRPGGEEDLSLAALRASKLRAFLGAILGERPSNDQMVTPLLGALR